MRSMTAWFCHVALISAALVPAGASAQNTVAPTIQLPSGRSLFAKKGCVDCHYFEAHGAAASAKAMRARFAGAPDRAQAAIMAPRDHAESLKKLAPSEIQAISEWLAGGSASTNKTSGTGAKTTTPATTPSKPPAATVSTKPAPPPATKPAVSAPAPAPAPTTSPVRSVAEPRPVPTVPATTPGPAPSAKPASEPPKPVVEPTKREMEADAQQRRMAEENAKRRDVEDATKRREQEEATKRLEAEETAKRDAAKRREQEEAAKRHEQEEAARRLEAEEAARRDAAKREAEAAKRREAEAQAAKKAAEPAPAAPKPATSEGGGRKQLGYRDGSDLPPCPPPSSAPGAPDENRAKEIIDRVGCPQCHAWVQKKTGPPMKSIHEKYKGDAECVVSRLKNNKTHNDEGVTRDLKGDEFRVLADYIATRKK